MLPGWKLRIWGSGLGRLYQLEANRKGRFGVFKAGWAQVVFKILDLFVRPNTICSPGSAEGMLQMKSSAQVKVGNCCESAHNAEARKHD